MRRRVLLCASMSLLVVALFTGMANGAPSSGGAAGAKARAQAIKTKMAKTRITMQQRKSSAALHKGLAALGMPGSGSMTAMTMPVPGGTPNYFGPEPNWINSPIIRKFVNSLPGLGASNANDLGQYLPVAVPDTTTYPGSDYYEISLGEYTEQLHSDLKPTKLRGYRQTNMGGTPYSYLGPTIIAHKDRPVRIKFTNNLPTGAGGNLFLPVDTTVMGAGMGPLEMNVTTGYPMNYTENRATLHLHGGNTPWISDGTMHQWITPAGELTDYPKGVSVQNVPDMPDPGPGSQTFFYTNQQSARLMFYHDHAYGITRLNVYAGEAAGYLLTDQAEADLISAGILPDLGTPLIIQDKTFLPDASVVASNDPTWPFAIDPARSDLWYPHVYMQNQNVNAIDGMNPVGRWDYGPWFWPPWPVTNAPILQPDGTYTPNLPDISAVMEAFMDTPLVNGTAYPYFDAQPKAYRFRVLNGSDDRFWNLGLYVVDPAHPTEVATVTAAFGARYPDGTLVNFPAAWQGKTTGQPGDILDGRDCGVPDPALLGPSMIQIGSEGGFLPAPVVIDSTPIGFDRDPKSITVGNVKEHGLFLGPAERADIIVDFSQYAGKTIILYNDSPAPVPATDSRVDYFTGDTDQTDIGGAPTTLEGYGPNTRTIMQIRVSATGAANPYDLAALENAFASSATTAGVFQSSQDPILVPQAAYNSAYNAVFPSGTTAYERIQNLSLTFSPLDLTQPSKLSSTTVTIANKPKAIAEEFESDWGRMSAFLGVEVPFTNGGNQTTIFYTLQDPATEILDDNVTVTPVAAADGTQLWKITHNGVDTHPVHFHLFNVQVINRVGWDGSIRPPDDNELGWKETVRMNPLEDIIVAMRPVSAKPPFGQPDSIRPLDPTMPLGSTTGFKNVDPNGNPVNVLNVVTNFGWEYVWHCHILSHEEMDMMRPMVFNVARSLPAAPVVTFAVTGGGAQLDWTDGTPGTAASTLGNPANEIGFRIERAPIGANGKPGTYASVGSALANHTTFTDATYAAGSTVSYRVVAFNAAGDSPSTAVTVGPPVAVPATPTNLSATLQAGPQATLTWTDAATNETGFVVERSTNGGAFVQVATPGPRNNTGSVSYIDTTIQAGNSYAYRVKAVNGGGSSAYSNVANVVVPALPAAPSGLTAAAARAQGNNDRVTLNWIDNATNESSYTVQRATNSAFTTNVVTTNNLAANSTTFQQNVSRRVTYWYRVRATNISGTSGWSNAVSVTTP